MPPARKRPQDDPKYIPAAELRRLRQEARAYPVPLLDTRGETDSVRGATRELRRYLEREPLVQMGGYNDDG